MATVKELDEIDSANAELEVRIPVSGIELISPWIKKMIERDHIYYVHHCITAILKSG